MAEHLPGMREALDSIPSAAGKEAVDSFQCFYIEEAQLNIKLRSYIN